MQRSNRVKHDSKEKIVEFQAVERESGDRKQVQKRLARE